MKKLAIILVLLLAGAAASAQIVTSTSHAKIISKTTSDREGLSYGAFFGGSFGFKLDENEARYAATQALWGDLGYYFSPNFYAGGALGLVHREVSDYDQMLYGIDPFAVRLLAGIRYLFSSQDNTFFVDYRAGVNVVAHLDQFGRAELGVGYLYNNSWEATIGLENEFWNALGGFNEIFKSKGFHIRLGYRFR